MTAIPPPGGPLDIGRVISETFGVIGRNFATFAVLSFLLAGLPLAFVGVIEGGSIHDDVFDLSAIGLFWTLIGSLTAVVASAVLQGTLIYATVQDMNGVRPSIGASLTTGFREFMPLLGVSILLGLSVAVGLILLIVPGIMIACAWGVAVPVLIAERTRVTGAFDRSAELTSGERWRIAGLFLLTWLAFAVIGAVFVAAGLAPGEIGQRHHRWEVADDPLYLVGSLILNTATSLITATGVAVLYVELRKRHEGRDVAWWSDVFR